MATITTREQFAELCLQNLGAPVITPQLEETQVDNCITRAIKFWQEYHFDGTARMYLKRQVAANTITLTTNVAPTFSQDEQVIGQTSGTKFHIYSIEGQTILNCLEYIGNSLTIGETIVGQSSGATAIVQSSIIGDIQNRWIPVPDNITAITRILNFSEKTVDISMFDIRYQMRLNDIYSFTDQSLVYYYQVRQQLELYDQLLIGQKPIRFNRVMNKCYIDIDWNNDIQPGDWLVFDAYVTVNPDQYPDAYNDRVLQQIATAYLKKQWGQNLSLYNEISLPGGVKLNGQAIYDTAVKEIENLERDFQLRYEVPLPFYIG